MKRALLGVMAAVLIAGCDHDEYAINMQPQGETIERSVTVWHVSDKGGQATTAPATMPGGPPPPAVSVSVKASVTVSATQSTSQPASAPTSKPVVSPEVLKRLEALYPKHEETPEGATHFWGTFKDKLPSDLGGGHYIYVHSELGSAAAYMERFGGTDDQAGAIQKQMKTADWLSGLLAQWAKEQFASSPDLPKLQEFLQTEFPQDLKNVGLNVWLVSVADRHLVKGQPMSGFEGLMSGNMLGGHVGHEAIAHTVQYLLDHGYVEANDAPVVNRFLAGGMAEEEKTAAAQYLLEKVLTNKLGLTDKKLVDALAGQMRDANAFGAANSTRIAASVEYKEYVRDWKPKECDGNAPLGPTDWALMRAQDALPLWMASPTEDIATVSFQMGTVPLTTNGDWDDANKVISWKFPMAGRDKGIPTQCFAIWATPDEKAQKAMFGDTVVTGEDLVKFCLWRKGLTAAEAWQWQKFLSSLKAGPEATKQMDELKPRWTGAATQPAWPQ